MAIDPMVERYTEAVKELALIEDKHVIIHNSRSYLEVRRDFLHNEIPTLAEAISARLLPEDYEQRIRNACADLLEQHFGNVPLSTPLTMITTAFWTGIVAALATPSADAGEGSVAYDTLEPLTESEQANSDRAYGTRSAE